MILALKADGPEHWKSQEKFGKTARLDWVSGAHVFFHHFVDFLANNIHVFLADKATKLWKI